MSTFLEAIKTWSPIIIPVLSLIAGGGWLQYYLALRSKKQEKLRLKRVKPIVIILLCKIILNNTITNIVN